MYYYDVEIMKYNKSTMKYSDIELITYYHEKEFTTDKFTEKVNYIRTSLINSSHFNRETFMEDFNKWMGDVGFMIKPKVNIRI